MSEVRAATQSQVETDIGDMPEASRRFWNDHLAFLNDEGDLDFLDMPNASILTRINMEVAGRYVPLLYRVTGAIIGTRTQNDRLHFPGLEQEPVQTPERQEPQGKLQKVFSALQKGYAVFVDKVKNPESKGDGLMVKFLKGVESIAQGRTVTDKVVRQGISTAGFVSRGAALADVVIEYFKGYEKFKQRREQGKFWEAYGLATANAFKTSLLGVAAVACPQFKLFNTIHRSTRMAESTYTMFRDGDSAGEVVRNAGAGLAVGFIMEGVFHATGLNDSLVKFFVDNKITDQSLLLRGAAGFIAPIMSMMITRTPISIAAGAYAGARARRKGADAEKAKRTSQQVMSGVGLATSISFLLPGIRDIIGEGLAQLSKEPEQLFETRTVYAQETETVKFTVEVPEIDMDNFEIDLEASPVLLAQLEAIRDDLTAQQMGLDALSPETVNSQELSDAIQSVSDAYSLISDAMSDGKISAQEFKDILGLHVSYKVHTNVPDVSSEVQDAVVEKDYQVGEKTEHVKWDVKAEDNGQILIKEASWDEHAEWELNDNFQRKCTDILGKELSPGAKETLQKALNVAVNLWAANRDSDVGFEALSHERESFARLFAEGTAERAQLENIVGAVVRNASNTDIGTALAVERVALTPEVNDLFSNLTPTQSAFILFNIANGTIDFEEPGKELIGEILSEKLTEQGVGSSDSTNRILVNEIMQMLGHQALIRNGDQIVALADQEPEVVNTGLVQLGDLLKRVFGDNGNFLEHVLGTDEKTQLQFAANAKLRDVADTPHLEADRNLFEFQTRNVHARVTPIIQAEGHIDFEPLRIETQKVVRDFFIVNHINQLLMNENLPQVDLDSVNVLDIETNPKLYIRLEDGQFFTIDLSDLDSKGSVDFEVNREVLRQIRVLVAVPEEQRKNIIAEVGQFLDRHAVPIWIAAAGVFAVDAGLFGYIYARNKRRRTGGGSVDHRVTQTRMATPEELADLEQRSASPDQPLPDWLFQTEESDKEPVQETSEPAQPGSVLNRIPQTDVQSDTGDVDDRLSFGDPGSVDTEGGLGQFIDLDALLGIERPDEKPQSLLERFGRWLGSLWKRVDIEG